MNITSVFSKKSKIQLLFEKILEYCKNEILKDRIINIHNLITNNSKIYCWLNKTVGLFPQNG